MRILKALAAVTVFVLLVSSSCFMVTASAEGAKQPLTVETTSYLLSAEWLPVGDEEGHVIGLQKRDGDVVFAGGENAKYLNIYTLDFRRGKGGSATGYSKFIFEDNSSILCSWTADIPVRNGMFSKQGQGTIVKGTGRFENIAGTVTFTGRQVKSAAEDSRMIGATTYYLTLQ